MLAKYNLEIPYHVSYTISIGTEYSVILYIFQLLMHPFSTMDGHKLADELEYITNFSWFVVQKNHHELS